MLSDISKDSIELLGDAGGDASPAWSIKTHGDEVKYTFGGDESLATRGTGTRGGNRSFHRYPSMSQNFCFRSYAVTSVRSLLWPGAVAVARGNSFANLYVGSGTKRGSLVPQGEQPLSGTCAFTPLVPDDIMEEPDDLQEEPEPNERVQEQESDGAASVDEEEG